MSACWCNAIHSLQKSAQRYGTRSRVYPPVIFRKLQYGCEIAHGMPFGSFRAANLAGNRHSNECSTPHTHLARTVWSLPSPVLLQSHARELHLLRKPSSSAGATHTIYRHRRSDQSTSGHDLSTVCGVSSDKPAHAAPPCNAETDCLRPIFTRWRTPFQAAICPEVPCRS